MPSEEVKTPEEIAPGEVSVSLSPDLRSILIQKDEEKFSILSISQWQKWAEENWTTFVPEPIIIADIKTSPEDFYQFDMVSLFPDKNKIVFITEAYRALTTLAAIGVLDMRTREISMIDVDWGDVEQIIWSPDATHFAYILGTARGERDRLSMNNVVEKKNMFSLDAKKIGQALGFKNRDLIEFMPHFRDVKWSSDGRKLYFSTISEKDPEALGRKDEITWVINVDGTDLEKIKEILDVETDKRLPRFEDFPIPEQFKGTPAPVDFLSHPSAPKFKTRLTEGAKEGPNFAGHYTIVSWGCSTNCQSIAVVDAKTGTAYFAPFVAAIGSEFRIDSNLFIVNPYNEIKEVYDVKIPPLFYSAYYKWENNQFIEIYDAR